MFFIWVCVCVCVFVCVFLHAYMYMLLHACKCNVQFTSAEPEGHRPEGVVLVNLTLQEQGRGVMTNLFWIEGIYF